MRCAAQAAARMGNAPQQPGLQSPNEQNSGFHVIHVVVPYSRVEYHCKLPLLLPV